MFKLSALSLAYAHVCGSAIVLSTALRPVITEGSAARSTSCGRCFSISMRAMFLRQKSRPAGDIEARLDDTDMRRPSCVVMVKLVNFAARRLTYSTASWARLCATTTAAHVLRSGSEG